jgi:uncharacterized membrane protein YgcG
MNNEEELPQDISQAIKRLADAEPPAASEALRAQFAAPLDAIPAAAVLPVGAVSRGVAANTTRSAMPGKFLSLGQMSLAGKIAVGAWALALTSAATVGAAFAVPSLTSGSHNPASNIRQLTHQAKPGAAVASPTPTPTDTPSPTDSTTPSPSTSPSDDPSPEPSESATEEPSPSTTPSPSSSPSATNDDDGDDDGVTNSDDQGEGQGGGGSGHDGSDHSGNGGGDNSGSGNGGSGGSEDGGNGGGNGGGDDAVNNG